LQVIIDLAGILPCVRQGTRGSYIAIVPEVKTALLNDIRLLKFVES